MESLNVCLRNNVISDKNQEKINNYIKNNIKIITEEATLTCKLKKLLLENDRALEKEEKVQIVFKIFDVIEEYSHIVFSGVPKWSNFAFTVRVKLQEFLKEDLVKNRCLEMLNMYFDEKCQAYTKWGVRCKYRIKNGKSDKFCGVHIKFPLKITNILSVVLPTKCAKMCINMVF